MASLKAYIDLTRAHFGPVWPLLFCSGAMLAFRHTASFTWTGMWHVALIGLLGGTGGIVLNDIIDRDIDRLDVEHDRLTRYWRPFGSRPIPQGLVSTAGALVVLLICAGAALGLIALLPFPNSAYVAGALVYCYGMESFYQLAKRHQRLPFAQVLGRTDLALFPAAGFMAVAGIAPPAFAYMLFFYPLTLVHLAVNDLADVRNDESRGLQSVSVLYGIGGTVRWIAGFSAVHLVLLPVFATHLHTAARYALAAPLAVLAAANVLIVHRRTPRRALKVLPLIHLTIALEAIVVIVDSALAHR